MTIRIRHLLVIAEVIIVNTWVRRWRSGAAFSYATIFTICYWAIQTSICWTSTCLPHQQVQGWPLIPDLTCAATCLHWLTLIIVMMIRMMRTRNDDDWLPASHLNVRGGIQN